MDINALTQLIGSVGFPIVMCGYMMLSNNKTLEKLTDVISNNTNILSRVLEHLGLDEDGDPK